MRTPPATAAANAATSLTDSLTDSGIDPNEVRRRADGIVDEVLGLLTGIGGAP